MNLRSVLSDLGAEDRELDHLEACDGCSVWNGHDGAEIERCPTNPVEIEQEAERQERRIWHGLRLAFGIPYPLTLMEQIQDDYRRAIVEHLNTPLWGAMTRSDA